MQSPNIRVLTEGNAGDQAKDLSKPLGAAIADMFTALGAGVALDPDDPDVMTFTTFNGGPVIQDPADPDTLIFTT
jgi:hypothetical protein